MPQPESVRASMRCPLCDRSLGVTDQTPDGRFHCPACAPTSKEAQYGWLAKPSVQTPRAANAPAERELTPEELSRNPMGAMFSSGRDGATLTRDRTCECGARFTQTLLGARFLAMVERLSPRGINLVAQQIPGYFVPVHCPSCERRDLGRQQVLDAMQGERTQLAAELSFAAD